MKSNKEKYPTGSDGLVDISSGVPGGGSSKRYKKDGVLWFFEACDLNALDITRALWHLDHCGWFGTAKGFVFGRPLHFGEEIMGLDQYRAVTNILGKYNVPILMDADLGHLPPSMPMMVGSFAELKRSGDDLTFRFLKK